MPIRILKKDKARDDQAKQQSARAQTQVTPQPQNLNRESSEKANEPTSPSARRDESKAQIREARMSTKTQRYGERYTPGMKKGGLKGNQKKLDKNNNNRIDAQDFKILKAEKAKGRGMGLQDEKVKPGKVMKAKKGRFSKPLKSDPTKAISSVKPSAGGKGSGTTNLGNPRKTGENFMERRLKLTGLGKAGRIGAAAALLGLAGAGAAKLGQTIGRKYFGDPTKKEKNKMSKRFKGSKKMGGGMMKKYSKGGDNKLQKGIEGTTLKLQKKTLGVFGDSKAAQKKFYDMTSAAKRDAHKKGIKEGKKFRAATFVDRKTGKLTLDTVRNRKRYGERVYKAPDVAYVEPTRYNKGGGADTGRVGELKSKIAVATDKLKKHFQKRKRRPDYIKPPERKPMIPAGVEEIARTAESFTPTGMGKNIAKKLTGKMGGGMMQKPMGYKSGTMVMARGCKLGRKKPTKMY